MIKQELWWISCSSVSSPSYVDGGVLLCGGRSRTVLHGDCVRYSPQWATFTFSKLPISCLLFRYDLNTETWSNHSLMLQVIQVPLSLFKTVFKGVLAQNNTTHHYNPNSSIWAILNLKLFSTIQSKGSWWSINGSTRLGDLRDGRTRSQDNRGFENL